jgi:hypothetical protein
VEKEYRLARSLRKDVLIFIRENGRVDDELGKLLSEIEESHTYAKYHTLDQLEDLVRGSILNLLSRQYQASIRSSNVAEETSTAHTTKEEGYSAQLLNQLSDIELIASDCKDHVISPDLDQMLFDFSSTSKIILLYSTDSLAYDIGIAEKLKDLSIQLDELSSFQFSIGSESVDRFAKMVEVSRLSAQTLSQPLRKRLLSLAIPNLSGQVFSNVELLKSQWERRERYRSRGEMERFRGTLQEVAFAFYRLGNMPYSEKKGVGIVLRDLGLRLRNLSSYEKYYLRANPIRDMSAPMQETLVIARELVELLNDQKKNKLPSARATGNLVS